MSDCGRSFVWRSMRSPAGFWGVVLVLGSLGASPALAQDPADQFDNRRFLNGHTFIPSTFVGDPFISSWVRTATGLGFATGLEVPVRDLDGEVVTTLNGDMAFLRIEAEFQQAFGRWLAVRVGGLSNARIGTNEQAILYQGINALYGFNLGTTVRILESDRVVFSAVGDYRVNQVYALNLFRFLRSVIDDGFDPGGDNNLVEGGTTATYSAGARIAYSPSAAFGVTALAETGLGSPFVEREDDRGLVRLGGTAAFDLGANTSVPIGIQAAFKWENFNDTSSDIADKIWRAALNVG